MAFVATADAGVAPTVIVHPLANAFMGDGVLVNAYLVPTGNSVQTTITLPDGTTFNNTIADHRPGLHQGQAVQD